MPSAPLLRCPAIPQGTGAHGKQKVSHRAGDKDVVGEKTGQSKRRATKTVGKSGRERLIIPVCSTNKNRGHMNMLCPEVMPLAEIPVFWPPCPDPAHELNEFWELNLNFRKQWSAKKCWPFTSARLIPQGSCLLLLLQLWKWRIACYLFGPDFCCFLLHWIVTGCSSRQAESGDCPLGRYSAAWTQVITSSPV